MHLTERHAALRATPRLLASGVGLELTVDLVEVRAARLGVAFLRAVFAQLNEFEHPARHVLGVPSRASATRLIRAHFSRPIDLEVSMAG
jgi:hypothetical protein